MADSSRAHPAQPAVSVAAHVQLTDLGMLLVVLFWGANITIVKVTFTEVTPLAFNALRFGGAALLLLAVQLVREGSIAIEPQLRRRALLVGLVGNGLYQLGFIIGLELTSAANTALLLATSPIWVALIGTLRREEHLTRLAWGGVLLSFVGIMFVLGASDVELSLAHAAGDLLVLASAVCWGFYTVGARPLLARHSALRVTTVTMLYGTPLLLLVSIPALLAQEWGAVSVAGWGGLAYSTICSIVLAQWIWNVSVRRVGPTRTGIYSNLVPVVGALIAWWVRGEAIMPLQVVGAAAIVAGLWLTRRGRQQ